MCVSFAVDVVIDDKVAFLLQVLVTVRADETVRVPILIMNFHHYPTKRERKRERQRTFIYVRHINFMHP